MQKKNVIFISEIQDPYNQGSSTQIMTENIIKGLNKNANVHFIAIVDWDNDIQNIENYFENIVYKLTIIKSQLELRKIKNKYLRQLKLLYFSIKSYSVKNLSDIDLEEYDTVITHSPSIESIRVSDFLFEKEKIKIKKYQYWSDPIALSGVYPEQVKLKRMILFLIEKLMHKKADKIIFGTKVLYQNQKKIFKNEKFRYSDVSYIEEEEEEIRNKEKGKIVFGYSGQYNSKIRDIRPLYNVFFNNTIENSELFIVGDSDLNLVGQSNVKVSDKRYSQNEIKKIEEKFDVIIVILNKSCIQIPGKVFYNVKSEKPIIVITDGLVKEEIKQYLLNFERFIFVENNEFEIYKLISNFNKEFSEVNNNTAKVLLAPSRVSKQILNGGLTD